MRKINETEKGGNNMACRILVDRDNDEMAVFYCSTTMWAFGPIMDGWDEAAAFLNWLPTDPREYTDAELETQYCVFREKRIPE